MKILGNRVLVSRIEEEKTEGFQTVNVQDSFVNKGKVEQVGNFLVNEDDEKLRRQALPEANVGDVILFAKYSPDTQEVKHAGKDMKIISVDDILAIL